MTLSEQVCSLDIAKRLKELGVGKERGASLFVWVMDSDTKQYKLTSFEDPWYGAVTNYYAAGFDNEECPMYSAFTVAELGEMLPANVLAKRDNEGVWGPYVTMNAYGLYSDAEDLDSSTEADARAKMLIYLLENRLMELPTGGTLHNA